MPKQALVTFGVALVVALLVPGGSAWSSEMGPAELTAPAQSTASQPSQQETTAAEVLTFADVLARVLARNPQLDAASREIEARELEAQQTGYYPNPELSFEVENFAGSGEFSGTDNAETTLLVSQTFELGGKRSQRLAVGQLDKKLAERDYAVARATLVAETTTRFVDVLAAQQKLTLAADQSELAKKVLAVVNERIAAGKTANIEKLRFQALLVEADIRTAQARQELITARQVLAALWDQEIIDFTAAEGDIEQLPVFPEWQELTEKLTKSPLLATQEAVVEKADQNLALEEALRIPDLTVSLGGKNFEETNDNAFVAGVAITLPLFDRNQGALGAAQVRQVQARATARATQLRLQTALGEIWQKLQATHLEATSLREQLLPAVEQSFEGITYGYQAGKFGYLEVLEAEQALFEAKSRYIEILTRYHKTYAELEQLLGQRLSPSEHGTTAAVSTSRGSS